MDEKWSIDGFTVDQTVPTVFDEQRSLTGAETCRDTGASNEISSKRF